MEFCAKQDLAYPLHHSSWTALMVATAAAGDRTTVAKVARGGRVSRLDLRNLRAVPRLAGAYPVPNFVLQLLRQQVRQQLLVLPHFDRTVHFYPTLPLGKVCWSPMVDAAVAPSILNLAYVGLCQYSNWAAFGTMAISSLENGNPCYPADAWHNCVGRNQCRR